MSLPAYLSIAWVLLASLTALLLMRHQYAPGITLLIAAPVLIIWVAIVHGWVWAVFGLLAFLSMFRNPLRYLWARARGERPEIPK